MVITKVKSKVFAYLREYFWFIRKRSMQNLVLFKKEEVLIKLTMLILSVKLKSSITSNASLILNFLMLLVCNAIKVNDLRQTVNSQISKLFLEREVYILIPLAIFLFTSLIQILTFAYWLEFLVCQLSCL